MTRVGRPLAVGLLSASTLAYELLLVRVFAIEHYHHFAYMAIGVAMLGIGASGTLLALVRGPRPERLPGAFVLAAILTPVSLIASPALVDLIPLDTTQLAWSPAQWPRLGAVYLLLALPFGTGALAVVLALSLESRRPGALYGASFMGSGVGAALGIAVLSVAFPQRALAVPALVAALGALSAGLAERGVGPASEGAVSPDREGTGDALAPQTRRGRGRGPVPTARIAFAAGTVVLAIVILARPPWTLDVTPYKGLPQVEAYPDARRVAERTSPVGWVTAVRADAFRHAPGLSLAYRGVFPRQTGLFVDGDLAGAATDWTTDSASIRMLDWLPTALPYALGGRRRVLVLGAGGGTEVWSAIAHGADGVRVVELDPNLVELARRMTRLPPGWGDRTEAVDWSVGDARSRVAGSDARFDLITLGAGGAFGASTAGLHALSEDFLHTVEAYRSDLAHLTGDGVLAITRWVTVPPRESVRAILTAAEALRRERPGSVERGLVVARSWATATVLVKPSGFADGEIESLREWAASRRFDLDWYPGAGEPGAQFNVLDEPTLFRAAEAGVAGRAAARAFADAYPFAVAPATDARPYPHHFLRMGSLPELLWRGPGEWLPFAEWGYIALLATFVQGLVLATLLLVLPALPGVPRRGGAGAADVGERGGGTTAEEVEDDAGALGANGPDGDGSVSGRTAGGADLRLIGYFIAIGLAFLAAEIAAIQQLNLLLGHPVYAVAAVLTALLVVSGLGSVWSDRLPTGRGWQASAALVGVLLLYAGLLLTLARALGPAPLAVRAVVGLLVLAPISFGMGLPFPTGLRTFAAGAPRRVAWAWASNGFASVVAAPLSALVALEAGSRTLFALAAAAYAVAALLQRGAARPPPTMEQAVVGR